MPNPPDPFESLLYDQNGRPEDDWSAEEHDPDLQEDMPVWNDFILPL